MLEGILLGKFPANSADMDGRTALMLASHRGHVVRTACMYCSAARTHALAAAAAAALLPLTQPLHGRCMRVRPSIAAHRAHAPRHTHA